PALFRTGQCGFQGFEDSIQNFTLIPQPLPLDIEVPTADQHQVADGAGIYVNGVLQLAGKLDLRIFGINDISDISIQLPQGANRSERNNDQQQNDASESQPHLEANLQILEHFLPRLS